MRDFHERSRRDCPECSRGDGCSMSIVECFSPNCMNLSNQTFPSLAREGIKGRVMHKKIPMNSVTEFICLK